MTYGSGNWAKHVATMEVREREPLIDTKAPYVSPNVLSSLSKASSTGFSSEIGTKLREAAVGQARGSCYSRAALSSNDSKTLYLFSSRFLCSLRDSALKLSRPEEENTIDRNLGILET